MSTLFLIERQYDYDSAEQIDVHAGYFATRLAAEQYLHAEREETAAYNEAAKNDPKLLAEQAAYDEKAQQIRALGGHTYATRPTAHTRHVDYSIEIVEIEPATS